MVQYSVQSVDVCPQHLHSLQIQVQPLRSDQCDMGKMLEGNTEAVLEVLRMKERTHDSLIMYSSYHHHHHQVTQTYWDSPKTRMKSVLRDTTQNTCSYKRTQQNSSFHFMKKFILKFS